MKVLCLGGGGALPNAVFPALRARIDAGDDLEVFTSPSMMDSGGSTGVLRKTEGVLPPGDIRRHLLAFSTAPDHFRKILGTRINVELSERKEADARHNAHNVFNMILVAYEKQFGVEEGYRLAHELMQVKGATCIPPVLKPTHIHAELEDGSIIHTEDEIDRPTSHDVNAKIKRVFIDPHVDANPKLLEAINNVDMIIIGPGDLYSTLVQTLLAGGVKEAMIETSAKIVLITPSTTKLGETIGFSVQDYATEIESYLGRKLSFILWNSEIPDEARHKAYQEDEPTARDMMVIRGDADERFIGADLLWAEGPTEYDPEKVVNALMALV